MGLLFDLVTLPVSGPIKGMVWISGVLAEEVDRLTGPEAVRAELIALHRAYEDGELDDDEFLTRENELLDRLEEIEEHG